MGFDLDFNRHSRNNSVIRVIRVKEKVLRFLTLLYPAKRDNYRSSLCSL
jgi:hypothetical protein